MSDKEKKTTDTTTTTKVKKKVANKKPKATIEVEQLPDGNLKKVTSAWKPLEHDTTALAVAGGSVLCHGGSMVFIPKARLKLNTKGNWSLT